MEDQNYQNYVSNKPEKTSGANGSGLYNLRPSVNGLFIELGTKRTFKEVITNGEKKYIDINKFQKRQAF